MGNAKPEVIAVAKRVIGHNRDEGLAEFLEEIVASRMVTPRPDESSVSMPLGPMIEVPMTKFPSSNEVGANERVTIAP